MSTASPPPDDVVSVNGLSFTAIVGLDQYSRPQPQPLLLSLSFHLHASTLLLAAAADDPRFSIRTWEVVALAQRILSEGAPFPSGRVLGRSVAEALLGAAGACSEIHVQIALPKAELCLRAECVHWTTIARAGTPSSPASATTTFAVRGVQLAISLGMSDAERAARQNALFDFSFVESSSSSDDEIPYAEIVGRIITEIEGAAVRSLEKLVHGAVRAAVLAHPRVARATIHARRTKAHLLADSVDVRLTRDRAAFA